MDNLPLFSIITITFNAESEVGVTVKSVADQTFRNFEHIIVDGGSTDNTLCEARKFSDSLRILSEKDRGLYDAMNKGIDLAKGKYIIFLNAGDAFANSDVLDLLAAHIPSAVNLPYSNVDVYRPKSKRSEDNSSAADTAVGESPEDDSCFGTYAEPVTDIAEDNDPDILYGDTVIVDENRVFLRPRHLSVPEKLTFKSFSKGMLICHQAFCVRKSIAPYYDLNYRFSADYDWCVKCIAATSPDKCVNVHSIIIEYLDNGLTEKNKKDSLRERYNIMRHYYGTPLTVLRHISFIPRAIIRKLKK